MSAYLNQTPEQKVAYRARVKAYRAAHPAKTRAWAATYRTRNRTTLLKKNQARANKRRQTHHDHTLNIALRSARKKLPIPSRPCPTTCELCGQLPDRRVLNLDHDHITGAFRGWLCHRCNLSLGKFGDNISGFQRAVFYLQRNTVGHGLPEDPIARKQYPLATGVFDYFPRALVAIAHVSYIGNQQHHPESPLHWDRSKSSDETDAMLRHYVARGTLDGDGIRHSAKMVWRALAFLEKELESQVQEGV